MVTRGMQMTYNETRWIVQEVEKMQNNTINKIIFLFSLLFIKHLLLCTLIISLHT